MTLLHNLILSKIFGGSGSGGSGMERFLVTFSADEYGNVHCDKTYAQIVAARQAGMYVDGVWDDSTDAFIFSSVTPTAASFENKSYRYTDLEIYQIAVLANGSCIESTRLLGYATVSETITGTAINLDPEVNHYYKCGTLTSLSIDSSPSTGGWSVRFTSGSTATVLTMPNTVVMPDGFDVEANAVYEINVLDNYALVASWPVASS